MTPEPRQAGSCQVTAVEREPAPRVGDSWVTQREGQTDSGLPSILWGHSGKFSADWEGDVKEDKQGCLGITVGDGEPWGFMELVEARTKAGMLVLWQSCWQS